MSTVKNPVQVTTRKMKTPNGIVSIDYPHVTGVPNANVQKKINSDILALVNKLIKDQGYYENHLTTVMGWYELKTNERGILSLTLGNYSYAYQAAHGMTVIKSLTFDIDTGKLYNLGDLFKPGSDYVKVLSDMVAVQIKERDITLLDEFKGISPDQDYYIADKSLVIYFQLYELTAYAYGFPFFPISVYSVQDIITEDGPLGVMAINS